MGDRVGGFLGFVGPPYTTQRDAQTTERASRQPPPGACIVIVSFVFPSPANSSYHRTGGLVVLYQFANGMARSGHEVHFLHGPAWPNRVESLAELPPFPFVDSVQHHIVDSLEDAHVPRADVIFNHVPPPGVGLPAAIIQGFRMLPHAMERDAYRVAAPKYCVAGWLVDIGRRFGVPEEQLLHVPLGLDHELFSARVPFDQREIDVVMVFNGHHQKGWKVGREAIRQISREHPEVNGVVFGMLPLDEELPRGFRFLEAPDHRTLADEVFNHAKVFVQPSYHEGFGYPAVEAMACGAALVTTDNGGSRDYGIDGRTAHVVLPGDAHALAEKTLHLLDDAATRTRFATAGTELVRESFDWDRSSALLAGHLERYVADPAAFQQPPADYEEWTGHGLGLEVR